MIFDKAKKENILQRADFIRIQLADLKKFEKLDYKTYSTDRDTQRNIERLVENVANASIDISKIILAGEQTEMPNSYKEIILKLGQIGVLEQELSEKIAEYAGLRNILAHQYFDIKWERIKVFIKDAPADFERFISAAVNKL